MALSTRHHQDQRVVHQQQPHHEPAESAVVNHPISSADGVVPGLYKEGGEWIPADVI